MKESEQTNTPEIAYSVQYPWGQLHVSESAHDAYRMQPLTPVIEGGSADFTPDTDSPSIELTVVTPSELDQEPVVATSESTNALAGLIELGPSIQSVTDIAESTLEQLVSEAGVDVAESEFADATEEFQQDAPQQLAHLLAARTAHEVERLVESDVLDQVDERLYSRLRMLGSITVLGNAGVVAPNFFFDDGAVGPLSYSLATLYSAFWLMRGRQELKRYMESKPQVERSASLAGVAMAQVVGEDIHASYCRRHFNNEFNDIIGS